MNNLLNICSQLVINYAHGTPWSSLFIIRP